MTGYVIGGLAQRIVARLLAQRATERNGKCDGGSGHQPASAVSRSSPKDRGDGEEGCAAGSTAGTAVTGAGGMAPSRLGSAGAVAPGRREG